MIDDQHSDPDVRVRAAVAGAPAAPNASFSGGKTDVAAALTAMNTKTAGYGGVVLVVAATVLPAIAPDIDASISAAHVPPIVAHGAIALVGAALALLGRWKTFE